MFGWLKLKHKLIALAALMILAQIASAFSTFVLVRRQVEAETLATATKNGQLLVERGNTLVHAVEMDSRGAYMSPTWEEASPFAGRMLQSLGELDAVARRLSLDGPQSEAAAIHSVRREIDDFIRFHRELVRLARESSPAAARAFGDNSADRANRETLNQELDGLTARYAHYTEINDARAELSRSRVVSVAEISAAMPIVAMMLGVFVILRGLAGAEREILKHTRRFEIALNNMQQGLCMFDGEDRLIVCNERYAQMYAVPGELTQPGAEWRHIVAHQLNTFGYRDLTFDDIMAEHNGADLKKNESSITRSLRDGRTILIRRQPIKEGGWVATHEDITERRKAEERLSLIAHHDALTGLANRVLFQQRMEEAVVGLQAARQFAVLCLDLDHFKETNDALGHAVGDALLREVAARLKTCVARNDTVARIGGDEFAIVQIGIAGSDDSGDLAQRLLDVLAKPYEIEGNQIIIGASIGIALAPRDESSGAPLLRLADIALYSAKTAGRNTWRFFEALMDWELQVRRRLEIDLRSALANEEFEVYFQPVNDAKTKSINSFEALVRWRHPGRGMISPAEFIPLAEETGLIVPLGEWVLRTACREATRWPSAVHVSVNLSACQFKAGLAATIRKALADSGLSARRLELEITETVLLDRSGDNLRILHELRDLGVKIAMDDFGTGYSSLSYLRGFPFDKIKIDQSFVRNVDQRDAREIAKAIAALGLTLGMITTAEGVETQDHLDKMIEYGCIEVQGYLFSRPVPASHLPGLLKSFNSGMLVA
jgi:diguanylate cyclase (GGDEF)-like protein